MYGKEKDKTHQSPVTARTFMISCAIHAVLALLFWGVSKVVLREPEVVIPIDMTIVPPWAEVDPDDPEPDPLPPPPEPSKPTPRPAPPKPDPVKELPVKQDAVERVAKKPKKEIKKAPLIKPEKKKKPEIKPGDFRNKAKLIKNAPKMRQTGKGTAREKPLSQAEIQKALNAGARFGASNQLAENEIQRCVSLVAAALKRHWTEEFQWSQGLVSVHLELRLGAGGRIRDARIVRSSGDPQVDRSVLLAARNTGAVPGLTPRFLAQYETFVIEMKPTRR